MENPYQSPQDLGGSPFGADPNPSPTWARQVPVVAILLMVQGGLELVMSAMLLFLGGVMLTNMGGAEAQGEPGLQASAMLAMLSGVYLALGAFVLAVGLLKLVAGWRNFRYRNRLVGILALISSLVSIFTCYCAPTGLLLCVYGLLVYLNGRSAECFARVAAGASTEDIRQSLA